MFPTTRAAATITVESVHVNNGLRSEGQLARETRSRNLHSNSLRSFCNARSGVSSLVVSSIASACQLRASLGIWALPMAAQAPNLS
jgi:hypothetical protein